MLFTDAPTSAALFRRLGADPGGLVKGSRAADRFKTFDIALGDRCRFPARIAKAVAAAQGTFTSCHVWVHQVVFPETPAAAWTRYRRWRRDHGETRPLREAPGHVFSGAERAAFAEVIALSIVIGWEALIAAEPFRMVVRLDHDGYLTVHARSRPSALIRELERFGLCTARRGPR